MSFANVICFLFMVTEFFNRLSASKWCADWISRIFERAIAVAKHFGTSFETIAVLRPSTNAFPTVPAHPEVTLLKRTRFFLGGEVGLEGERPANRS